MGNMWGELELEIRRSESEKERPFLSPKIKRIHIHPDVWGKVVENQALISIREKPYVTIMLMDLNKDFTCDDHIIFQEGTVENEFSILNLLKFLDNIKQSNIL